jgi:hypothetical protein
MGGKNYIMSFIICTADATLLHDLGSICTHLEMGTFLEGVHEMLSAYGVACKRVILLGSGYVVITAPSLSLNVLLF